MAVLNFDARTVAPDPGTPEALPAGWYNVVMISSEMKPTADGMGQRLAIVFQVIDGQFAGRKIFEGLNLVNSNAIAQEIAYKQLSAIGHAVGHTMIGDSAELHNKPLKVKVKLKPATGQYEAGNSITAYKNINEVVAAAGPANPFASAPAAPAVPMPPGPAAWTPAAAPQQAPQAPAWQPPPAAAPAQPWQPPPAPVAPPQQAPAAAAAPPVGMQPQWAQAPQPAAAPAPAPQAAPQLQPPPGYAPAPAAAAPAPAAPAPGAPAQIQPPWATPAA